MQEGPPPFEGSTLDEARQYVEGVRWDGGYCPCCGQNVKVYKRSLNTPMTKLLIWLVETFLKNGQQHYINVHKFPFIQGRRGGGDFAKLQFWGLIEQEPVPDEVDAKHSGEWRPTKAGIQFVQGNIKAAKYVMVYLNDVVGTSEEEVTVQEALKKKFSFAEVMSGNANYLL